MELNGSVFYRRSDTEDDNDENAYHVDDILSEFDQLADSECDHGLKIMYTFQHDKILVTSILFPYS